MPAFAILKIVAISGVSHLEIVSAPETLGLIKQFLAEY